MERKFWERKTSRLAEDIELDIDLNCTPVCGLPLNFRFINSLDNVYNQFMRVIFSRQFV